MTEPPTRTRDTLPGDDGASGSLPTTIGPFRILERIGAGGMGIVYLGERREPIEQRAALKVIRTDRLDKTYRARFAMEQTALARMDHPNIARLLDAGASDGQSWFAMEYVPGTPLSDYCREHRLPIEARLRLFAQICDGVQHAHMKGILHRDLKPGNILVREIDGRPVAKIIDFGLAQPTDPLQIRATLHESMRQIVGTFAYMSPEQAARTEGDLDTRTDVYSLGVVLYELLTGEVPLDLGEAERRGLAWIAEFLREHEPKKPSTRLSTMGERLSSTAAERATSPQRLRSSVRGDLDWVTMKALARDRQLRYPTVRELGREVERVLRHEPVEAGPPSGWYVAKKWVRRHARGVVTTACAAAVVIVATGVIRAKESQAREAERRRDQLAAASYVDVLVQRAKHELWPATAAVVPLLEDWLLAADRVLGMEDQFAALEAELGASDREGADLVASSQLRIVRKSREGLDELRRMRARIEGRRQRSLDEQRRVFEPYRATWGELLTSGVPGPLYGNLKLQPLPGLVPIGPNPRTQCYEFYMPASAGDNAMPERDAHGDYTVHAHTGLIFVLVPGGSFDVPIKTVRDDARERRLEPFLISRYEMTQAQWARLVAETWSGPVELRSKMSGNDPHGLQSLPGVAGGQQPSDTDLTWEAPVWVHPTQQVSWEEAAKFLPRWRLALPTVAQWWWAANGKVEKALQFSWLPKEVGQAVNFSDEARDLVVSESPGVVRVDWRALNVRVASSTWDGFVYTAPVATMLANPFGLHGVFGNVGEWCRDGYSEPWPPKPTGAEDCCVDATVALRAMVLGSSFVQAWDYDRSLIGRQTPIGNIAEWVGLRPVYGACR